MFIEARYVGTRKGELNYLFLLLTEDYIESHIRVATELAPHLECFAASGVAGQAPSR